MTHFGKANALVEAKRARVWWLEVYLTAQQRVLCRVEHVLLNRLIEQCTKTAALMIGINCNTVEIDKTFIAFSKPSVVASGILGIWCKCHTESTDFALFIVYDECVQ